MAITITITEEPIYVTVDETNNTVTLDQSDNPITITTSSDLLLPASQATDVAYTATGSLTGGNLHKTWKNVKVDELFKNKTGSLPDLNCTP